MATDIVMPQLGESIAEGTIVKWLITPGQRVEKDQSLLEVETDKVALEIPSPAAGTLAEVLHGEGDTVPVGTIVGRLEAGEAHAGVVNRVGGVVVRHPQGGEEHYSPAVRQLAQEHGVDLSQVTGKGHEGRVTKKDVLEYVAKRTTPAEQPAAGAAPSRTEAEKGVRSDIVPLTSMRRAIAERMVKSKQTSAHVATVFEADLSTIAAFRRGRALTYLPFVVHAVARALADVPILNSSWAEQGIAISGSIHIGIAVALEEGLLVPVIRDADGKGLVQLGREINDLAGRARAKRLTPEEVQGGTFTITNHGGGGSLFSTPIIHQPQIAILGVGAVQKRPVIIQDAIAIRTMAYLSLSFDHRVIDGATADRFMSRVKHHLEHEEWEKRL